MMRIGNLCFAVPCFQAGLAGYSDTAMRLIARRHGAPYAISEAMLDQTLIHGGKGLRAAELADEDHPVGGQLMGSHPADIAQGAKILLKLGYDVIDVNLACPVKKIRRKSRGGHLLSVPDDAVAILDSVRQATPPEIPCTVKIRRGTDDSANSEANFRVIFEAAMRLGYAAATVHPRSVEQKYTGRADWRFLKKLVTDYGLATPHREPTDAASAATGQSPPRFQLFGSGDVFTAAAIFDMIEQTGVTAAAVARGAIGNPWIFQQALTYMTGDLEAARRPPTTARQKEVLLEHFDLSVRHHGEERAARIMRKFGIKFARHHPQPDQVAAAFIAVQTLADWRAVIDMHYKNS